MSEDNQLDETKTVAAAVAESALLVTLTLKAWSGRKVQRALSDDVASARQAKAQAFAVNKDLFPGSSALLKEIRRVQADFRGKANLLTLPLHTSNSDLQQRLLANVHFEKFVKLFTRSKRELDEAVADAVDNYDAAIEKAKEHLGAAFDPNDYPSVTEFKQRFRIHVDFMPIPNGKAFGKVALPEGTIAQLENQLETRMEARVDTMKSELEDRARHHAKHIIDRMTIIEAAIKERDANGEVEGRMPRTSKSMFTNSMELSAMLRDFGHILQSDALLDASKVLAGIGTTDPDDVKGDPVMMRQIRDQAEKVLDCFDT